MRLPLLLLVLLSFAPDASAYLDPATGSIILQALIAGIAAFLAFVRNPLQTIKGFLARFRKQDADPTSDTQD